MDSQRRAFLSGRFREAGTPVAAHAVPANVLPALPWFDQDRASNIDCSDCLKCVTACPTKIIEISQGGRVGVNFHRGECEFCRECADICPEQLFNPVNDSPWQLKAVIEDTCLANQGIVCQTCRDQCPSDAIDLTHRIGTAPGLSINSDNCNGCGACVAPCPESAIAITQNDQSILPKHNNPTQTQSSQ
ncbi:ferredoxin-type protein NapF [Candidatus Pelagadaptatus aseana]|uniref:ferredoxin-type protein NapF n=1 Tax=Candidatus Pelagadaptatus aseana TaxID=3120508 RepID=UPI003C6F30A9